MMMQYGEYGVMCIWNVRVLVHSNFQQKKKLWCDICLCCSKSTNLQPNGLCPK